MEMGGLLNSLQLRTTTLDALPLLHSPWMLCYFVHATLQYTSNTQTRDNNSVTLGSLASLAYTAYLRHPQNRHVPRDSAFPKF